MTTTSINAGQSYLWQWQQQPVEVAYQTQGTGPAVLFLPAFSTVSSRREWDAAAKVLAQTHQTIQMDWPGFGESTRGPQNSTPEFYHQFLADFVDSLHPLYPQPMVLIAAGHASGYALQLAQQRLEAIAQVILVAPTWRGPLPTMGAPKPMANLVNQLVRSPLLGQVLYYLNTRPSFLKWMYQRHVYKRVEELTPTFIADRYKTTQVPGARFGPAAFVTGQLDPVHSRAEFLALLQSLEIPCTVFISEDGPPKSKAEMEALATLHSIQTLHHAGSLGLHEEYGVELGQQLAQQLAR